MCRRELCQRQTASWQAARVLCTGFDSCQTFTQDVNRQCWSTPINEPHESTAPTRVLVIRASGTSILGWHSTPSWTQRRLCMRAIRSGISPTRSSTGTSRTARRTGFITATSSERLTSSSAPWQEMNVAAITSLFRPRLIVVAWVLTCLLSLVLLRAPHAGVVIYYLFAIVGWPFFYYDQHSTIGGLCIAVVVQLLYVSVVQPLLCWLYRTSRRS